MNHDYFAEAEELINSGRFLGQPPSRAAHAVALALADRDTAYQEQIARIRPALAAAENRVSTLEYENKVMTRHAQSLELHIAELEQRIALQSFEHQELQRVSRKYLDKYQKFLRVQAHLSNICASEGFARCGFCEAFTYNVTSESNILEFTHESWCVFAEETSE